MRPEDKEREAEQRAERGSRGVAGLVSPHGQGQVGFNRDIRPPLPPFGEGKARLNFWEYCFKYTKTLREARETKGNTTI